MAVVQHLDYNLTASALKFEMFCPPAALGEKQELQERSSTELDVEDS